MITIHDIKLDFSMGNSRFARELFGRWDVFCRTGVEEVMDRVFSRYDSDQEVIRVGKIELDLGRLPQEEFYERFPKILEDKLAEVFYDLIRHREGRDVNIISLHKDGLQVLLYFLLYGRFSPDIPEEYRDLRRLLEAVLEKKGYELGRTLRDYGEKSELRRRLVLQFRDVELERMVEVTEPSEAMFIKVYTRSLITAWPRLRRPEITSGEYRNVVWEVVWAYLLYDGRGFFSRKQLVRQTIEELAARFNLKFFYLLGLLTAGLKKMVAGWLILPELSVILSEIRREETEKLQENAEGWQMIMQENIDTEHAGDLRKLLSSPVSCRRLLQPMKEDEIYRLVEIVVPAESRFIISYAQKLEREKEKGMLEGRAGNEFRILKWEFLFQVLLSAPMSAFHRKRFVLEVIRRIASHYNVDTLSLLVYLCTDREGLPPDLQMVLQQLYKEQTEDEISGIVDVFEYRMPTEKEREYLKSVLSHSRTAGRLLRSLPETGIYRLTRMVIPDESNFVISYARTLEREKGKGMLEGKGGEEFRVLKWEFIFIVILSAPGSTFSRRQFVRSVLGQIAAHYNLAVTDLLVYFYEALVGRDTEFPQGVADVLREWIEEQRRMEKIGQLYERPDEFPATGVRLKELIKHPDVTVGLFEKYGPEIVGELWAVYRQTETLSFIRKYKKVLWDFVNLSVEHIKELYRRMRVVEGLSDFLIKEYGKQSVEEVMRKIGVRLRDSAQWQESVWREALRQKQTGVMEEMLVYSPGFVRQKTVNLSPVERTGLEEVLKGNPELIRKWLMCVGTPAVRQAVDEVLRLKRRLCPAESTGDWLLCLLHLTYLYTGNLSYVEILRRFMDKIADKWTEGQRGAIYRKVREQADLAVLWERIMENDGKMEEAVKIVKQEEKNGNDVRLNTTDMKKIKDEHISDDDGTPGEERGMNVREKGREKTEQELEKWNLDTRKPEEERVYMANAGAVILAPYFPRLFDMLGMTEKGVFVREQAQIRAVFAIQYLVFGQTEFPETELALNKLLTGLRSVEPLPLFVKFTEEEKEVLDSLLKGAMGNWSVMKGTSVDGFRGSFLIRNGVMAETGELWQLTVEEKSYDILLDSIPWNISPVKFSWMEKPLYVNWR